MESTDSENEEKKKKKEAHPAPAKPQERNPEPFRVNRGRSRAPRSGFYLGSSVTLESKNPSPKKLRPNYIVANDHI